MTNTRIALTITAIFASLGVVFMGQEKEKPVVTFHHCTAQRMTTNYPHQFDYSESYKCDEGTVVLDGKETMVIEDGYLYNGELGREERFFPRKAWQKDYEDYKWCRVDSHMVEMCGTVPRPICIDGKMETWDKEWQGYACPEYKHPKNGGSK